jgi:hypothetical protein
MKKSFRPSPTKWRMLWQQTHGEPPRRSYHDREWAGKMKQIGLQPSDTGEPGGKEAGQSVTHYIVAGAAFAEAYAKLKGRGFELHWQSAPGQGEAGEQDEIHLPGLRTERLGQTRYCPNLRAVLRRWRGRDLCDARRDEPRGPRSLKHLTQASAITRTGPPQLGEFTGLFKALSAHPQP